MVKRGALLAGCALVSVAGEARAQVDNTGVLDEALTQYRSAAETWQNAAQGAATSLFWSLAAISLVWTMGQLVLRRADIGEFFAELIRYLLFTGFWAWMLANGPAHAQLIVDSMVQLASSASAQNRLTPSGVLDVGFHILDRTLTQSTISSPLTSTIGIVVALGILVVLALAAVNMLVSLIACWMVAYGGLIVLGFGGSRWTSDMAVNYYRMVLSLGLQVLAMILLVGMGESFLRNYFNTLEQSVSLHELAVLLVVSLVLLVTVNRIPALLGTLASGSSPQYALGGGAGAGAAMSAISTMTGLAAWSSVAGRTVTEGAGRVALGAGSLARAMAAATTGGTSSAMGSLLDGFRSGGTEAASRTAGEAGGSVFAAPAHSAGSTTGASAQVTSAALEGSRRTLDADGGQAPDQLAQPNAIQADQAPTRTAEKETAEKAAARAGVAAQREAPADGGNGSARSARPDPEDAKADAPPAGVMPSGPGLQRETRVGPSASDQGTRNPPDSSGNAAKLAPDVPVAPHERSDAGSHRPAAGPTPAPSAGASIPAGTFAHPPSAVAARGTAPASLVPSSAATAASPAPQATAPTSAIAAATRGAAPSQDIPFSTAANNDPVAQADQLRTAVPAVVPDSSDRAKLPTAYSEQTTVDVEAEVAAFRDRD